MTNRQARPAPDESTPKPRAPWWAWLFVAGCVLIPILTLGGAIPGAIGGGGAFACHAVAREASNPTAIRIGICAAILAGCWLLFLLVAGGLAILDGTAE
ncbi:MAG: hypothetical protein CMJ18_13000 [Phycisphaeraceae bacterium]|nr:hypothetical protein [Phycisphaeraceae bacterium]